MSEMVFAEVRPGRLRRMPREEAESSGYRIDVKSRLASLTDRGALSSALDKVRGLHGNRGVGGAKVVLTQAEKSSLYNYTGVRVDDAQHARRVMKEKNVRFCEKGEQSYDMIDALKEHADTGNPLDPRYKLENIDLFQDGWGENKKFDIKERYLQHCQRLGVRPDFS